MQEQEFQILYVGIEELGVKRTIHACRKDTLRSQDVNYQEVRPEELGARDIWFYDRLLVLSEPCRLTKTSGRHWRGMHLESCLIARFSRMDCARNSSSLYVPGNITCELAR